MAEQSAVELVIKAVQSLPPDERDRTLAWLVDRGAAGWASFLRRAAAEQSDQPRLPSPALHHDLQPYASLHGEHQAILVRLPVEAHARLRGWCEEHEFAMATVIRGLVDRFLDQQAPA